MASTYTSLTYHIIFGTKYRKPMLTDALRQPIWNYISGVIAKKQGQLIEIGGIEDHVHILTSCSPSIALSEFIRDIKANSSKWLHEEQNSPDFQWQTGYGAFTVSHSQQNVGRRYLKNQADHHQRHSFEDEYRQLLQRHQISFEEKYLFEDEYHG
jgi:putative transposase